MSILIAAVVFGLLFAYFSVQNTTGVPLQFASYSLINVPIYAIALGSLLIGLLLSWVISMLDNVSSTFRLQNKEHTIHEKDDELNHLKTKLHDLEIENAKLRGEENNQFVIDDHPQLTPRRSIWDKLGFKKHHRYST